MPRKDADDGPDAHATSWRRGRACSGLTSRLIVSYIEREVGPHGVDELLKRSSMAGREAELRDENSWFSFDEKIGLWRAAEEVSGDKRIAERVGESALEFNVALGLKRALR